MSVWSKNIDTWVAVWQGNVQLILYLDNFSEKEAVREDNLKGLIIFKMPEDKL